MEKVYKHLNNNILRRDSKTFLLRLFYLSIWVVVYMLAIPVGEVFCPNVTPNSKEFFIAHNEPSDFQTLQILGQITLEGKILPFWITSSWPYNAETRSRSHYTTKVMETIQAASCLKSHHWLVSVCYAKSSDSSFSLWKGYPQSIKLCWWNDWYTITLSSFVIKTTLNNKQHSTPFHMRSLILPGVHMHIRRSITQNRLIQEDSAMRFNL